MIQWAMTRRRQQIQRPLEEPNRQREMFSSRNIVAITRGEKWLKVAIFKQIQLLKKEMAMRWRWDDIRWPW
jgi:Trp operon repressor